MNIGQKMNIKSFCLIAFWLGLLLSASCARRGVPTGGPKDTIPPVLLNMNPELETVNFGDDEILLEFDEFIEARSLKQDLIVNPPIDDYDFYVNRRSLVLELNEELQENTTYTFNFRDAIKDISEQNPAENIVVAFSTGDKIDSFQVQGQVANLFTNEAVDDAIVALYPESDTLTPFEDPPTYLTKTDEEGNYTIKYIRIGTYKLYAFVDENNNLKIDSNNEPFGFESEPVVLLPETASLMQSTGSVSTSLSDSSDNSELSLYGQTNEIKIYRQDVRDIEIQSSRANGKYYEIKANKSLSSYELVIDYDDLRDSTLQYVDSLDLQLPKDTTRYVYNNFQEEQKTIRIYNTLRQDSLLAYINLYDSVDHLLQDTVYIKFSETRREQAELSQTVSTKNDIRNAITFNIAFSKPITNINRDSILLSYDTLFYIPLNYDSLFTWNDNLDSVGAKIPIDKNRLVDTIRAYLQIQDSSMFETTKIQKRNFLDSIKIASQDADKLKYFRSLSQLVSGNSLAILTDSAGNIEDEVLQAQFIDGIVDTLNVEDQYQRNEYPRTELLENLKELILYLSPGSFLSIENDSSTQILQRYAFKKPAEFGNIKGNINTEYASYVIQLLDKNFELVAETSATEGAFSFELVPPGEYVIRVLIDENLNGKWDKGNILQNTEPEPVFFYTEEELIELRANWQREINLSF